MKRLTFAVSKKWNKRKKYTEQKKSLARENFPMQGFF